MFGFFKKRRINRIIKYTDAAWEYMQEKYIQPIKVTDKPEAEKHTPPDTKPKIKPPTNTTPGSGVRYSISGAHIDDILGEKHRVEEKTSRETIPGSKPGGGVRYSRSGTRLSEIESNKRHDELEEPSENMRYSLKEDDRYNASEVTNLLRNVSNAQETLRTLDKNVDQTFVDVLLQYIRVKGVRDSAVYKAAQVDKRLFSKMVSNREYKPSKDTAIAFALALKLSLDEANDILSRAGYTFSHSNKRDIIIEFFFREKIYNLFDANEVLHNLNQKLIGRF